MSIPSIELKKFDLNTLERKRLEGNPPTILIIGKRGCLGHNTPVRMYDKSIKMVQDIELGDRLRGDDDAPRTVMEILRGKDRMYKVTQSRGMNYVVNEQHILTLYCKVEKTVFDIKLIDFLRLSNERKKSLRGIRILEDKKITSRIDIELVSEDDMYYGFMVDKNNRFLLSDYTVTHNSGKSTLISDILWHMKKTPLFICMSGTEDGNGEYQKYFHPLLIHSEYKPGIVDGLISRQKKQILDYRNQGFDPKKSPGLSSGILLDDCGFDKQVKKDQNIKMLFMNGRHWKICLMISLQYVMGLPPDVRTNVDYVFCLRDNLQNNQKRLYDNFFGCFDKLEHFKEAFINCTEDYGCMVLDNTSKSVNLEDCVFHYRAVMGRKFKVGSPELYRKLDTLQRSRENDDSDSEEYKSQKKQSIIIKKKK